MINESILIQEINKLKTQISLMSNEISSIKYKLNNNIGVAGPPGPIGPKAIKVKRERGPPVKKVVLD